MRKNNSTNSQNKSSLEDICPMLYAMQQINGRWKVLILWYVKLGANRFGKLRKALPSITTKMLTQQLRELEADSLLNRTIFAEMPPRVEYELTEKAQSLAPILSKLNDWGLNEKNKMLKDI